MFIFMCKISGYWLDLLKSFSYKYREFLKKFLVFTTTISIFSFELNFIK